MLYKVLPAAQKLPRITVLTMLLMCGKSQKKGRNIHTLRHFKKQLADETNAKTIASYVCSLASLGL